MMRFMVFLMVFSWFMVGPVIAGTGAENGESPMSGFYAGKLGGSLSVTLSLRQSGDRITGYYHYDKSKVDIRLEGRLSPDGVVSLTEFGYFEPTGRWSGRLADGRFSGRWTSGDGKRNTDFSVSPLTQAGQPGAPIGKKVAFGAVEADVGRKKTRLPMDLASLLVRQLVESGELDGESSPEMAKLIKKDPAALFSAEQLDLNGDGVAELAVQTSGETGACTAQNCSFWVFRKQGQAYVPILSDLVGYSGYMVLNQGADGFADLAVSQHVSAADTLFSIFRFDGQSYRPATCFTRHYRDETNFGYVESRCQP